MKKDNRKSLNQVPDWQSRFNSYSMNISDLIYSYITKKNMTTIDLAEKVGFTKSKAKHMMSGSYDFSIEEMSKLELLFAGHYDNYEKKLLTEKISKK
jgi:ribosome-binding protein aMBF1 (putative translation factor)